MTKYLLLNTKKYDYPPTKKPRTAGHKPEVHIAVNIMPMSGMGRPTMEASYAVSENPIKLSSTPAPGPSQPAGVSNSHGALVSSMSHQPCVPPTWIMLLHIFLECIEQFQMPTTLEVLTLMDTKKPAPNLKYVDVRTELSDHGVKDTVDLHSLHLGLLITFGDLGMDGTVHLHQYTQEKMIAPLGLLETRGGDNDSLVVEIAKEEVTKIKVEEVVKFEVEEVASSVGRQLTWEGNGRENVPTEPAEESQGQEAILQWLEGVESMAKD